MRNAHRKAHSRHSRNVCNWRNVGTVHELRHGGRYSPAHATKGRPGRATVPGVLPMPRRQKLKEKQS